ncbi:MAG TPA: hypothetical protein VGC22_03120 [Chitinophaga sp.]
MGGQSQKSITLSDYVTTNNKGTIVFKDGKFTTTDVSYDLSCNVISIFFDPEADTLSLPFQFSLPPTSSAGTYKVIGDSLYTNSALVAASGAGQGSPAPTTTGGRLSWSGDTMVLTSTVAMKNTTTESGMSVSTDESARVITKLVK